MLRADFRPWIGITAALLVLSLVTGVGVVNAVPPGQETPSVFATVVVERAVVFPFPDRTTEPLTYLYERERVPVLGQSADGAFLYVPVSHLYGWVLRVQVELEGDVAAVPVLDSNAPIPTPTLTITPFGFVPQPTAEPAATAAPGAFPTRTPLPTRTPQPTSVGGAGTPIPTGEAGDLPGQLLPGVPPPIEITLPDAWQAVHLIVPFRTFDGEVHDVPLSIYAGPFGPDATGIIYVYWGFPNTVDWVTGEKNLWADGVQILSGSLIGETCNLGQYGQQVFTAGDREGTGAYYQAADCEDETDTAGWFLVVDAYGGSFAFYTAVEPWVVLADYQADLQAILDTVVFLPPEE